MIRAEIAKPGDQQAIIELLQKNNLPVDDLETGKQIFWTVRADGQIAGTIALETCGGFGLLRSMATNELFRNKGVASALVDALFEEAGKTGLIEVYLLTETAEKYFERKGFLKVSRDKVPAEIKQSKEFTHLCPSTAVVMKKPVSKKKLLFVCIENSNRSQMSQALAAMLGGDAVEAYSAGSKPSGVVNPKAIAAMKELGYDLGRHDSKSLDEVKKYAPFDVVVTMGCGDACPWMPAKQFVDWQIPDPRNMEKEEFNAVRDLLRNKVQELLGRL